MEDAILSHDEIAAERRDLLRYVKALRRAIAELRPAEMRAKSLPSAMTEIGMIVETTEAAANEIMASVEEIMGQPEDMEPQVYRAVVEERCLAVMAACSFQDLTGQRINKIVEMLLRLEGKVATLGDLLGEGEDEEMADEPHAGDEILLNGPAMPGEGVDQSEIDALFA
jgi:chemotaxis protein CheZ